MRILSRPMFRYGGPIGEGIMHGMRNGGRTLAGGNQLGTPMGNRTGFANPKDKLIMGAASKILPKIGIKPGFLKPWWSKIKKTFGTTAEHQPITKITKPPVTKWSGPYKGTVPGGTGYQASGPVQKVWTPKGWVARDPLWQVGSKAWEGKGYLGKPIKWAAGKIATPTGIGLTLVGTKWLWPDGTPANENEVNEHLNKGGGKAGGVPGGGDKGMMGTGEWFEAEAQKKLAAKAKAERKAKLEQYLDTMGYDKAKKGAIGDALIDASAIVQDATSEAGSLKHADWGKMINKAIQATSKRLDKPEQIREAVGLMTTKAAIEKDMTAEKDALDKLYKTIQIQAGQKALKGNTLAEDIAASFVRNQKLPSGGTLAGLARTKGIEVTKVIASTEVPEDMSAIDYITTVVENSHKAGEPFPPGNYVIKDRLVQIDVDGTITDLINQ